MRGWKEPTACALLAGSLAGALLLRVDPGNWTWAVSRSAGLLSYAALTGSVIAGLSVSTRISGSSSRRFLVDLHSALATVGLVLVGIHAAALVFDTYRPFSTADVLLPLASDYRRAWTGSGVVAAWLAVVVAGGFWLRDRRHPRLWRRLHTLAFPAWFLGLLHGLGTGTDTETPWVYWSYVLSAASVAGLVTWRLASAGLPASGTGRAAAMKVSQPNPSETGGARHA